MFPSINNVLDLEAVSDILNNRKSDFTSPEYILEALIDGITMGPHMSCSYIDITR